MEYTLLEKEHGLPITLVAEDYLFCQLTHDPAQNTYKLETTFLLPLEERTLVSFHVDNKNQIWVDYHRPTATNPAVIQIDGKKHSIEEPAVQIPHHSLIYIYDHGAKAEIMTSGVLVALLSHQLKDLRVVEAAQYEDRAIYHAWEARSRLSDRDRLDPLSQAVLDRILDLDPDIR